MRRPTNEDTETLRVIRWEEPPTVPVRGYTCWDLGQMRRELEAQPGRWAVVAAGDRSYATKAVMAINSRTWGRAGSVRASVRQCGDEYRAYARWVPEGAA